MRRMGRLRRRPCRAGGVGVPATPPDRRLVQRRAPGEGCGRVSTDRPVRASLHDAPFDAIPVGRGLSGTWGMRDTPRLGRRGPSGASCMSGSDGRPPGGPPQPPRRPCDGLGLTAGTWRGVRQVSADRLVRANLQNTAIERICAGRAVLRVPYMGRTARSRRIVLRCRVMHPREAAERTRDDRTHPQVPAVVRRESNPGRGIATPPVIRPASEPGTEDRDHARRARMLGGTGPGEFGAEPYRDPSPVRAEFP